MALGCVQPKGRQGCAASLANLIQSMQSTGSVLIADNQPYMPVVNWTSFLLLQKYSPKINRPFEILSRHVEEIPTR